MSTPSPIPAGHASTLGQSNSGTALVDATAGNTYAWSAVSGRWVKSNTKVNGSSALHLTTDSAFTVDRAQGIVRQLDPATLSAGNRQSLALGGEVSDSIVDGSGSLWLALPSARRVVSVTGTSRGPALTREFSLDSSGSPLVLTALKAGALASDAAGHSSYRIFSGRDAAERINGSPPSPNAITAMSSDDDTGAVLDPQSGTIARIAPVGDQRVATLRLGAAVAGDRFGRPLVFGGKIYIPDYTTSKVLRSNGSGTFDSYPPEPIAAAGATFDIFTDDGRLWVNPRSGARAFSVDQEGRWTPIIKAAERKIKLPKELPKRTPTPPKQDPAPGPTTAPPSRPTDPGPPGPTATKAPTPTASSKPPPPPPGAPTNLESEIEDGAVTITWQEPTTGAEVTGYQMTWTGPDGDEQTAELDPGTAKRKISGLTNGNEYQFSVVAHSDSGSGPVASVVATPLTRAGVEVTDVRATGRGRIQVDFAADRRGSGPVTCQLIINGAEKWNGGCDGPGSQTFDGLPADSDVDVYMQATNGRGATTSAHRTGHTWPNPSVTIRKGASARGYGNPTCVDPSCAWIDVHLENFAPGQPVTMNADSSRGGGFPSRTVTPGGDGKLDIAGGPGVTYYFGYQGGSIWVTVDGVESPHLAW